MDYIWVLLVSAHVLYLGISYFQLYQDSEPVNLDDIVVQKPNYPYDESNRDGNPVNTTDRNYRIERTWFIPISLVLPYVIIRFIVGSPDYWMTCWLITSLMLTFSFYQRVREPRRFIIELSGRYVATWGSGFHFLPWFFSVRNKPTLAIQRLAFFLDGQEHKDEYEDLSGKKFSMKRSKIDFLDDTAGVEIVAFFQIFNPFLATYRPDDFIKSFMERLEGAARPTLQRLKLDDALKIAEGASKIVISFFISKVEEGATGFLETWQNLRGFHAYSEGAEKWNSHEGGEDRKKELDDDPDHKTPNPFLNARTEELPLFSECQSCYSINEWGARFAEEGIVVSDFNLSESTVQAREKLLEANREVRIADRKKVADRLEGEGRRDRLKAIAEVLANGTDVDPTEAVDYDIADKMTAALEKASVKIITADGLARNVVSGIVGKKRNRGSNGSD